MRDRQFCEIGLNGEWIGWSALLDVAESVVNSAFLGLAFMLVEIRLKLLPGFLEVHEKFLAGAERQSANIAVRQAGRAPDEPDNLEAPFRHRHIMAGREEGVKRLDR